MILTKEEIQAITLNAKFVHKYADQVFFADELNHAPQRIGDQPFLNFFVRYHHRDAPERYSWSRVRRVLLLEDAIAAAAQQRPGATPPATSETVEWRGKTVWVCLAVESVQPHVYDASSSAALANGENQGEELVMLQQLSNTVPGNEEVLAFCVASASRRPTEKYVDGVLGDAPAVPSILQDQAAVPEAVTTTTTQRMVVDADENNKVEVQPTRGEVTTATAAPPAALDPRLFVPTHRQVELLKLYKKQHFTYHQWTESEIEQSKVLRQRYGNIGVAAAPVRTVAYEHEHRVMERKYRAAAPASPVGNLLEGVEVTQDPLSQQQQPDSVTLTDVGYPVSQIQPSYAAATATATAAAVMSLSNTPLSPFLPRSVLRQQLQPPQAPPHHRLSSATMLAPNASTSPSFSQFNASQGSPPPLTQYSNSDNNGNTSRSSSQNAESNSALSRHLSQLRAAEVSFYKYISDEKRSHYLNRLADITLRNSATNAQNRRRGIANERRLERKGNLLESRGLWITDDKERAKQAEDYVKASVSGGSDAQKNEEKRAAKSTVVGSGAGESSDTAKSAEDIFVEKFKAYHNAQRISFSDCVDDLLSGTDADVEPIVQAAAAVTDDDPFTNDTSGKNSNNVDGGAVTSPVRANRRAVRRLLPNRLNTEEASPRSVQAQLVHRSTLRMAKRMRVE